MRREALVVVVDLDGPPVRPHPQPPADQAVGRGVVGAVHHHMAVVVELGELPDPPIVGTCRKGEELLLFRGKKAGKGTLLRCPVDPHTRSFLDPLQELLVRPADRLRRSAGEEIPLHVANSRFHLPFMTRCVGAAGRDQKTIVLGQLPIAPLCLRFVKHRLDDRRLQVVDHQLFRHAPEMLERLFMAAEPGRDLLIEHERRVLVAAVGEGHHEDPCLPGFPRLRVDHLSRRTEVHLGLLARADLDPHKRGRRSPFDGNHIPAERRIAPLITVVVSQSLKDRHHLHALLPELLDHRPVRRCLVGLTGKVPLRHSLPEKMIECPRWGKGAFQEFFVRRECPITLDRLPGHPQVAGDRPVGLPGAEPAK